MSHYKYIVFVIAIARTAFLSSCESFTLIFPLAKITFFSSYKMFDSENNPNNYKTFEYKYLGNNKKNRNATLHF